jgi:hypothetical protein
MEQTRTREREREREQEVIGTGRYARATILSRATLRGVERLVGLDLRSPKKREVKERRRRRRRDE